MDHVSPKNEFEMFSQEFYHDEFSNLMLNSLNISPIPEFYPATIAPSALQSSPKDIGFRRSDSPDATIVGARNYVPVQQPRDESSSPSSSDAFQTPLPLHNVPPTMHPTMNAQLAHLTHSNLSSTSLSGAEGMYPHFPGGGRTSRASARNSPPASSSPRTRNKSPAPDKSPKRNGGNLVHRPSRSNTAGSRGRRGSTRKIKEEDDWSEFEEDEDFAPNAAGDAKPERRREDIRRQRIESEQRRRDELREGYNRLKSALPPSNQKSSKASILERATVCITDLNHKTGSLSSRVDELESELRRVRAINETLMLSAAEHRSAAAAATFAAAQAGVHLTPVGFQQA